MAVNSSNGIMAACNILIPNSTTYTAFTTAYIWAYASALSFYTLPQVTQITCGGITVPTSGFSSTSGRRMLTQSNDTSVTMIGQETEPESNHYGRQGGRRKLSQASTTVPMVVSSSLTIAVGVNSPNTTMFNNVTAFNASMYNPLYYLWNANVTVMSIYNTNVTQTGEFECMRVVGVGGWGMGARADLSGWCFTAMIWE